MFVGFFESAIFYLMEGGYIEEIILWLSETDNISVPFLFEDLLLVT